MIDKRLIDHLHDAIFAAIEPHAEDLRPDETHSEAVKRVLRRELPNILSAASDPRRRGRVPEVDSRLTLIAFIAIAFATVEWGGRDVRFGATILFVAFVAFLAGRRSVRCL